MLRRLDKRYLHLSMVKSLSLLDGIGDLKTTKKYYDNWSNKYDLTLNQWNYTAPKKSLNLLKTKLINKPNKILDLACGTGLFGEELIKLFSNCQIYGSDISQKSLAIAKDKNIYKKLTRNNFEFKKNYKTKFQLVSMIGSMTYCVNHNKLFSNIKYYLSKNGHFIFTHRIDLWEKQKFGNILEKQKGDFIIKYISRKYNYLPNNKDFKNKIKIRLVLLQKT